MESNLMFIKFYKTKLLHSKSPHLDQLPFKDIVAFNHHCIHTTQCNCNSIHLFSSHTHLQLIKDDKFNCDKHIDHVCDHVRQFLVNFSIIKYRITLNVKMKLYN